MGNVLKVLIVILALFMGLNGCGIGVSDYDEAMMDGLANLNFNKPEEALQDFEKAIKIDPGRAEGYLGKANALNMLGRYREAIECYNQAISIDPTLANAYVNRAIAYSHLGEYKKAIKDYEKGLELDPKIDDPPGFLKRLFSNEPNREKGIRKHLEYLKKQVQAGHG